MTRNSLTVYVIDDDRDVRTMISRMVADMDGGRAFTPYPVISAREFVDDIQQMRPGVVLLDLRMPDFDGFALLEALQAEGVTWPVVAMTGASDVSSAVRAMKLGAVDYLEKPIRLDALQRTLDSAAALLGERAAATERRRRACERLEQLSAREAEVLQRLISGCSNKEIANELAIGLRTVEMHRSNMMERLGVSSLAEAVALALDAGLRPGPRRPSAALQSRDADPMSALHVSEETGRHG